MRPEQAASRGLATLDSWGEAAPGEPFYLSGDSGDLRLELGVADEIEGRMYPQIHSVAFDIDGAAPPVDELVPPVERLP